MISPLKKKDSFSKRLKSESFFLLIKPTKNIYTNTIEKDVTLKAVRDINKTNEERFIRMLTKILNTIVFN